MKSLRRATVLADADHGLFARSKSKSRLTLWGDRSGVTTLEYALLGSFVAASLVFAAPSLDTAMQDSFSRVLQAFEQRAGGNAGNPSALPFLQCRIEPAEFNAVVRDGDLPVGSAAGGISSALPGRYVTLRCRLAVHASQQVAAERLRLDLGHLQP